MIRPTASEINDDQLDSLYAERDQYASGLAAIRRIHHPATDWSWKAFGCQHNGEHGRHCASCRSCYPCPTATAAGAQPARIDRGDR